MDDTAHDANDWYSDASATFGDRVAGAREALGLSQEELARRMGIKIKTLRAWENDLSEPRANKLQMLAGILNVSIRWLLTGEGEGIDQPGSDELPRAISDLLVELRDLKGQMTRQAERIALVEKRLRAAVAAGDL